MRTNDKSWFCMTIPAIYMLLFCLHSFKAIHSEPLERDFLSECTIGVFGSEVTSDGRPILWKNRDVTNHDQLYLYFPSYNRDGIVTIPYTGNVYRSDTTRIYMGANAAGFTIVNSDSYNLGDSLDDGIDDGMLMRVAMETCTGISDFESLLDSTNIIGREDCWNFGVFDASGACAMFECSNYSYCKFVPDYTESPNSGFIIRANFSQSGSGSQPGLDRLKRAQSLTENRLKTGLIDVEFVLGKLARDLGNIFDDPYPLPYFDSQAGGPPGYIFNYGVTIANSYTSSAVAIKGVTPSEPPSLTTIFAMLGPPVLSVAFPLWVEAATVPIYLSHPDGAPVYLYCMERTGRLYDNQDAIFFLNSKALCDDGGGGVYAYTLPLESWGIGRAEELLSEWRIDPPHFSEIAYEQFFIARALFTGFQSETFRHLIEIDNEHEILPRGIHIYNYPNPFNSSTFIYYSGTDPYLPVKLKIYDSLGRLVKLMRGTNYPDGYVIWNGDDLYGNRVGSGVYFCILQAGNRNQTRKMLFLK